MKVKCFGCDALIEADTADAVADAFVAHGAAKPHLVIPGGSHPELRPQLRRGDRAAYRGHGTIA